MCAMTDNRDVAACVTGDETLVHLMLSTNHSMLISRSYERNNELLKNYVICKKLY